MKKIILIIPIILIALFLTLPSFTKSTSFKHAKEYLNVVPTDHSLSDAKDYVLITDEIEIFKKLLVETPIDLNVTENSPETVKLVSEDEEKRAIVFNLNSDENKDYAYYTKVFGVTYDKFNGEKSFTDPFAHNRALGLKNPLLVGKEILRINESDKKGYIQSGAKDKCTNAIIFIDNLSVTATFCGISEKERDFILYTIKSA